jgi:GTP-binding nuclear protein Ran
MSLYSINIKDFNIIIVGDAGVGKTTFINRWHSGKYIKQYIATEGVKIYKSRYIKQYIAPEGVKIYKSMYNEIKFNIIDTAGQEKYSKIPYNKTVDAAIIMFDVQSNISYKNIPFWYDKINNEYGNIPIVICGNKVDILNRKVEVEIEMINYYWKYKTKFFDVSSKSTYNYEKPFMTLINQLMTKRKIISKL